MTGAVLAVGAALAVWRIDPAGALPGLPTQVLGHPRVVAAPGGAALDFDGKADGLLVAADPLVGRSAFTIQVLVRPERGGNEAQRFLHLEDSAGTWITLETRSSPEGSWALDTYLHSRLGHRTLLDRGRIHPAGRWTWTALRYDGSVMSSWVDGREELRGAVPFAPLQGGRASLGLRLNRLYWFKGAIAEVRFSSVALAPADLRR